MTRRQPLVSGARPEDLTALAHDRQSLQELQRNPLLDGRLIENIDVSSGGLVKVKHRLGRAYRGVLCVSGTPVADDAANPSKDVEIWLRPQDDWESMGRKEVKGALATTIDFAGLKSDAEKNYKLEYELFMDQGTSRRLRILLNNSTANLHAVLGGLTHAGTLTPVTANSQIFCGLALNTGGMWRNRGQARFAVGLPSATRRSISTETDSVATTTTEYRQEKVLAQWQTTAGELTSASIQSTASGSASALIEPASWAELFRARIPSQSTIWVF